MSTPTCDCVPLPRIFGYDDSQPTIPYGDLRTSIADREYYNDQTITDFQLPVCRTIGDEAFRGSSLTGISAPMCVSIGDSAFVGCQQLKDGLYDFSSVKSIGTDAFRGIWPTSQTEMFISIPNVEIIGSSAFYNSRFGADYGTTQNLDLPKCTKIGEYAFGAEHSSQSKHYKKILLPSIEEIGTGAFYRLSAELEEVHLGPNCRVLGNYVFYDTYSDSWALYVEAISPPQLGGLGEDVGDVTIYVPAASVDAYKSASGWSTHASYIYPIPT